RLDRLRHHRAAVEALQVPDRHLAGTKAVDADLVLQLVEARIDLGIEVVGRNDDAEFALEAFRKGFCNLHDQMCSCSRVLFDVERWCGRRDLNPQALRRWNLNPVRLPVPPRPPRAASQSQTPPGGAAYITRFRPRTKR